MKHIRLAELMDQPEKYDTVTAKGWVRTFRAKRFIALNDGSTSENLQCVVDFENTDEDILKKINTGAAVEISGKLVESIGRGQSLEIIVDNIKIIGEAHPELYPIQPKKHSFEFLREKAHLRVRTATFSAVMRIRSELSFAIHQFFHDKGFYYIHTPIITGSDSEGAGEIFRVSVLDPKNPPVDHVGEVDFKQDFFGKQTNLTVSGQLEAETYAQGLGNVYTFGPTFRAENSNTSRHLAEFWMIEPEMAFYELEDNMDLSEEFVKYTLKYILEKCKKDLSFLDQRLANEEKTKSQDQRSPMGLLEKINFVVNNDFKRVTYTEAIDILKNSKLNKRKKFDYLVNEWGAEIQSEHERYLVEKHFNTPVILYDYPAKIKSFYMRMNDDQKTVRAMDVLFPGVGEIVGGSQREERLNVLEKRIDEMGIDAKELWWYLDLRRFGTTPHSGFGLGFERLVLFATGMSNIRDVIPFPRTPQNGSF